MKIDPDYWRRYDNYAPCTCYAAVLIVTCRNNPEFKKRVLSGEFDLGSKHIIENEHQWKEEDLWLKLPSGKPAMK